MRKSKLHLKKLYTFVSHLIKRVGHYKFYMNTKIKIFSVQVAKLFFS
jgi:hypothetical protein